MKSTYTAPITKLDGADDNEQNWNSDVTLSKSKSASTSTSASNSSSSDDILLAGERISLDEEEGENNNDTGDVGVDVDALLSINATATATTTTTTIATTGATCTTMTSENTTNNINMKSTNSAYSSSNISSSSRFHKKGNHVDVDAYVDVASADKEMEERAKRAKELLSMRYKGMRHEQVSTSIIWYFIFHRLNPNVMQFNSQNFDSFLSVSSNFLLLPLIFLFIKNFTKNNNARKRNMNARCNWRRK